MKTESFKNLFKDDLIRIILMPNHYQAKQTAKFKSLLEWTIQSRKIKKQ